MSYICTTIAESQSLASSFAQFLNPGSVVALYGALAAGKTCFAQAVAKALGVDEAVTSPTFTIISEYEGALPVYHMDMYRLSGADDFTDIGGEDCLYGDGVCLIEWAKIIDELLPRKTIHVSFEVMGNNARKITIENAPAEFYQEIAAKYEYTSA